MLSSRCQTKPEGTDITTNICVQTASFVVHGETNNQKESTNVWQVASVAVCIRSKNFHSALDFQVLGTPARISHNIRLDAYSLTVTAVCRGKNPSPAC